MVNETTTLTLSEFLKARLDEYAARFDEAAEAEAESCRNDGIPDMTAEQVKENWRGLGDKSRWTFELADVASKRAIVNMHTGFHECPSLEDNCGWVTDDRCATLRLLAAPYSRHVDYQEAWT